MIVFDLDGTLALDHHRKEHLLKEPKDWDTYFSLCHKDEPHAPIIKVLTAMSVFGCTIGLWSGRSAKVKDETMAWLKALQILPHINDLRLRGEADFTQDDILKKQWLHAWNAAHPEDPVTLVFEDRKRVVDMWRENGGVCCQVAPGDF